MSGADVDSFRFWESYYDALRALPDDARRSMELTRSARAAGERGGRPRKGQERGA